MAIKGSDAAAIVRVPWNDQVLIKPVLDLGADGVIVTMVQNAEDVSRAVAACRYPPEGVRGFGPLRPLNYGRLDAAEYCSEANDSLIVIVQIEQQSAVETHGSAPINFRKSLIRWHIQLLKRPDSRSR